MSASYEYSIDQETNAVSIKFTNTEDVIIYQPHWPNGDEWETLEDAENWAKIRIAELVDPTLPDAPAGPGFEPVEKKPLPAKDPE